MDMQFYFWDLDGTLVDSYPNMVNAIFLALKEFGKNIDKNTLSIAVKQQVKTAYETFAGDIPYELFKEKWKNIESQSLNTINLFPYAIETLELIKNKSAKQFLYTHRDRNSTLYLLEKHNISQYFEKIISADDLFPKKPHPAALVSLLNKYKIPHKRAYMIGDRDLNILAAENAGIKGIYIGKDTFLKAALSFASLKEFYEFLLTE